MAVKANATPRAKGGRKPAHVPTITSPQPAKAAPVEGKAVESNPVVASKPVQTKPAPEAKPLAPAQVAAEKPAEVKAVEAKPAEAKPEPVKTPEAKAPPAATQSILTKPTPATSTAKPKEPAMTTLPTFDVPEAFKTAFADFQDKAKAAYEKSTAATADYSDFAKGNIEALVEAGKIFTAGLQELGTALVADSREAFETLTSEVKTLAAAKTPTDFVQIQSDLLKKHFDKSVAFASKQSEAALKLASETAAPISGRVSLAVEKIKAAA